MSEDQAEYDTELSDAAEMLGAGYEHPSIEIVPESTIIQRHGRVFVEHETPAFVKISTAFKLEMAEIDEISLKVWLYIALSVNRNTGKANPGIRTIAAGCALDKDTVSRAVKRLEGYGLLTVDRESKKYNIYEPTEYVSANKSVPTGGTMAESVPTPAESVPTRRGLNQSNHIKNNERPDFKNLSPAEYRKIPELKIFLDATGWTPGSFVIEAVYDFVNAGLSEKSIRDAFTEWNLRGYKPANVKGYLTWARDGIPPAYAEKNPQPAPAPLSPLPPDPNEGRYVPNPNRTRIAG